MVKCRSKAPPHQLMRSTEFATLPHMPPSPRTPSLKGQILTCVLFVALAIAITALFHPSPKFAQWHIGQPIGIQLSIAGAFAVVLSVGAVIAFHIPALLKLVRVPAALLTIDLSGVKPWVVGLCAGIGEELLFRAALQPLVGLWIGAVIFAVAHARTALIGSASTAKRSAYLLNVAGAGLALGLVFEHLGLVAAILIHATIDVVGLIVFRSLVARGPIHSAVQSR